MHDNLTRNIQKKLLDVVLADNPQITMTFSGMMDEMMMSLLQENHCKEIRNNK